MQYTYLLYLFNAKSETKTREWHDSGLLFINWINSAFEIKPKKRMVSK